MANFTAKHRALPSATSDANQGRILHIDDQRSRPLLSRATFNNIRRWQDGILSPTLWARTLGFSLTSLMKELQWTRIKRGGGKKELYLCLIWILGFQNDLRMSYIWLPKVYKITQNQNKKTWIKNMKIAKQGRMPALPV